MRSSPAAEATRSNSRTGDPRNISTLRTCPAAGCELIGSNEQSPNRTPRGSPAKNRTSWIRNNGQQAGRGRAAGFQLGSATAGIDGLSVGFAVRLHGPSSASRLPSITIGIVEFLSAGRSRRNMSATNTTAFSTSQLPTMILKADMDFLLTWPLENFRAEALLKKSGAQI